MSAQVDILDQLRQLAAQAGMEIVPATAEVEAPTPKKAAPKAAPKAAAKGNGKGTVSFAPEGERTSRNGRKYTGRARLTVEVGDTLVTVYAHGADKKALAEMGARLLNAAAAQ